MTNFYLRQMTVEDYKELYFKRWPIETKYDIVKNRINLENFTGRTIEAISQDFYTCMYLTNMVAIFKDEADEDIQEVRKDKNNKHEYQANINEIVGTFKDRFVFAVNEKSPTKRSRQVNEILEEIKDSVVPKRPGRSVPRHDVFRQMKHYHNQKNNW